MVKLHLEKLQENDFDKYYRLVSDEKVMAQITERATPLEEAKENFKKLMDRNKKHVIIGSYKVVDALTSEFIGLGYLTLSEEVAHEGEIGYMLLPAQWGKGYGTAIAERLIDLSKQANLRRLIATIDPENLASRKILLHHKFVSEKLCEMDGLPAEVLRKEL
ncbi:MULTISPECIES: GNAT family N-acetyltransferase [Pontibacillus]|uniref:GNAT family N-acetyltransferase n=1 Tax=Pontibacillus chungwhensis TaxID=265426 RepID=A0ABY8V2G9_9BACI|nr:GNAT family N-acetyltransferase [Pontibacillus chungwhensis]MCD5324386.1 GNAT family N-acetyltransferase [Pontibacillus sp. HN14]WIG00147.1 GNAT family N-acetyltransferase [Pontibacillus chungwhensis]